MIRILKVAISFDFDASFEENSTPDNPFINYEADEANEIESEGPVCKNCAQCVNLISQRETHKTEPVLILHAV